MPEKCLHTLHVCDMPWKRHPVSWLGFLGTGVDRPWILPPPSVLSKQDPGAPGEGECAFGGNTSPKRVGAPPRGSGPSRSWYLKLSLFQNTKHPVQAPTAATPTPPPRPHYSCLSPPRKPPFADLISETDQWFLLSFSASRHSAGRVFKNNNRKPPATKPT